MYDVPREFTVFASFSQNNVIRVCWVWSPNFLAELYCTRVQTVELYVRSISFF